MDLSHYCPSMLSLHSRHRGNGAGGPLPLSRGGVRLCALGSLEPSVQQYCSAHKGERVLQRPQVNRAITSFCSGMRASSRSGASLFPVLYFLPLLYFIFYSIDMLAVNYLNWFSTLSEGRPWRQCNLSFRSFVKTNLWEHEVGWHQCYQSICSRRYFNGMFMICQMGLMCHCCATSEANQYSVLDFLDFVSHALVLSTAFVVLLALLSVNIVPETTF